MCFADTSFKFFYKSCVNKAIIVCLDLTLSLCALLQTVHTHKPHFVALHCQEVGGKNYEESMAHVDSFVK